MSKQRQKSLVEAFSGHPPNTAAIDVAGSFNLTYSREGMSKVMAAVHASGQDNFWHKRSRDMIVQPSSFAKSISSASPKRSSLSMSFGASKSFAGYTAPRAVSVMPTRAFKPSFSFFGMAA
ncbi:MAG: hypothetical protein DI586_08090 [Micavibrio aeruginosavorus]|uniref:Uncharacterized protein n=1 Tax=Micavibrio aeruginosavorus TaxID=349221 RepID=A0A2W5FG97_9BACT|nr:MAG: hypothetical protein DI586_08090 [Micavibrio aeruginosavorus]